MIRLGVLGSTRGTHLTTLVEAIHQKRLNAEIAVVASNKAEALILEKARHYNLPACYIAQNGSTRSAYDAQISNLLQNHDVDLIVLIGFMRILSPEFVQQWANQIINLHPSLLPAHAGLMDRAVHEAVLTAGESESGCSVHFVSEVVDEGPIVVQKRCPVFPNDSIETLRSRVQQLEAGALIEAINHLSHGETKK